MRIYWQKSWRWKFETRRCGGQERAGLDRRIAWLDVGPLHFYWRYWQRTPDIEPPATPEQLMAYAQANEDRWRRALEAEGAKTITTVEARHG